MQAEHIADALSANRARIFVGRASEQTLLDRLVSAVDPARVLFFHGAAGIGKSALLDALEQRAAEGPGSVVRCDARMVPSEPRAARLALEAAMAEASSRPVLLMIDTFELWAALEAWLREEWVPGLSDAVRLVIAGREVPSVRWRTDPAWQDLLVHHQLGPLSDGMSRVPRAPPPLGRSKRPKYRARARTSAFAGAHRRCGLGRPDDAARRGAGRAARRPAARAARPSGAALSRLTGAKRPVHRGPHAPRATPLC